MKNYEFYKDKLSTGEMICVSAFICRHGENCKDIECSNCAFYENLDLSLHVLFDEHKEQVKLKRWEYNLMKSYTDMDEAWNGRILHECYVIRKMCNEGYFKNVDLNMTFREVLDNCEVIDD